MDEQEIKKEEKDKKGMGGIFIPAGLFIGMGIGFLTDELVAGLFIGLGAGFVLFAISLFIKK